MSSTFHFVRHGATEFNEAGRFMGLLDPPLSVSGVRQALTLRERLKGRSFDVVYSSPLLRAYQTAVIAIDLAVPSFHDDESYTLEYRRPKQALSGPTLHIEPRLAERSFGDLQGEVRQDYHLRFPGYAGRNVTKSFRDRPDGGESFADLEKRVRPVLAEIEDRYGGGEILLFSHNGTIRAAAKILEDMSEDATLALENPHCAVITLTGSSAS